MLWYKITTTLINKRFYMAKQSTSYHCKSCNYQTLKWVGCCPGCNEWDSLAIKNENPKHPNSSQAKKISLTHLDAVEIKSQQRLLSGITEWDRVIGGGIVPGSLLILTGDPGIGKSTLLLQVTNKLAEHRNVFYFSTEESIQQVATRAQRLQCKSKTLLFSDCANLENIIHTVINEKPDLVVIDSVQNCRNSNTTNFPGSVGQLRESTFKFMQLAKEQNISVIISGHITKEGNIAGPKTLEHMVDGVFYLQGEDRWQTRILRAVKNRFGTINEVGFFNMEQQGLTQVPNINEHLVKELTYAPGSSVISVIQGSRPLLLELQALTIATKLTIPQRIVSGVDHKQVVLIAAILEKYLQVKLSAHDIFFKVSGSTLKLKDNTSDLGIALALLSSYFQQPLPEKTIALGEISVTGQIKPVNQINMLAQEATSFGIKKIIVAKNQKMKNFDCNTIKFSHVYELLSLFS